MDANRLVVLRERYDRLRTQTSHLEGKLESCKDSLHAVEEEIRALKINPEDLEQTISKLEEHYEILLTEIEVGVQKAEQQLEPFMKEMS